MTIKNNGSSQLLFLSPAITKRGSHAGDFELMVPTKLKIEPGAVATVKVGFRPSEAGTRKASILVRTNDPETPSFVVNLKGGGIP